MVADPCGSAESLGNEEGLKNYLGWTEVVWLKKLPRMDRGSKVEELFECYCHRL